VEHAVKQRTPRRHQLLLRLLVVRLMMMVVVAIDRQMSFVKITHRHRQSAVDNDDVD
jgi:hypothetical protein